ncbi:piggyBac transposable element-derived protein 4 [Trichonephila clavipes]|nr:piggyBac transposable element-derived protein 4 [Trichonephila clavipes]
MERGRRLEMINVLPFSSKVGLKVDAISFKTENDFFKLMLTDEILAVLVEETNRYAFDLLNLHGESSDKRKHASSWKPTDKNEILKISWPYFIDGTHRKR